MAYTDVGIDTSHWNPKLDAAKLGGLKFLIGRMGTQWNNLPPSEWLDHTFTDHCQVAYDLDIPYGAYWYDDYTWWLDNGTTWGTIEALTPQNDPRIVTIKRALFAGTSIRKVHFLAIDVEQEERGGKVFKEPNWASKSAQSLFENLLWMMNHGELPVMPILIYSRKSYVDDFLVNSDGTRPLETWMNNHYKTLGKERMGGWIADWRYNRTVTGTYTADKLVNTLPLETSKPATFGSVPDWLWQYGGDIGRIAYLDGVTDERNIPLAVDINTPMIPLDEFYRRLKFTPHGTTPPPVPEPEPEPGDPNTAAALANILAGVNDIKTALAKGGTWKIG